MDKAFIYGYCTRADGTRIPVHYFYEIEDDKVQIHHRATDEWIDINESWSSLGGRPNNPRKVPLEVTEFVRIPRSR